MKKDIHPEEYRLVVFKDMSVDESFLTRSAAPSKETVKWEDGNEYPLIKLEVSNNNEVQGDTHTASEYNPFRNCQS